MAAIQRINTDNNNNTANNPPLPLAGSIKSCLGDLNSGRAFDNGCSCFDSEEARCNALRGKSIDCTCGVRRGSGAVLRLSLVWDFSSS